MPPKSARKTVAGPGTRRGGRGGRGTPRTLNKKQGFDEIKVDEASAEVKIDEVKAMEVVEEKSLEIMPPASEPVVEPDLESLTKTEIVRSSEANSIHPLKKEDETKESTDEYEKDERLDLDDNEPDYEPEEYVGVDYDEKEIEQEDVQVERDEIDEEAERDVGEEGHIVEEENEDPAEELEGEEEDGHGSEEQPDLVMDGEEEDHHDVFYERRKRKEFEVFVGGLDKDATEDDLRKVFSEVGEVTEVRLLMNPQTKKNKGFAFLRFASVEQAKRACTEMKTPVVNGKQCGVSPSQDSDTLFLGNICKTWTKEALKAKLKHYGIENIEDLTLVEDSNNEGLNRGFAFLEFSSRSIAMDAFKRLQKRDVLFGVDRSAKVTFADSFIDPGDEIMAQVKTVFIDGLIASWDEDRLRELLKTYGGIEKIELARNMPSAKRKDFGFVTFDTHDAAVLCAKCINNEELGEGNSKAKVRVRLSRPLQRGKGKHAIRDIRPGRGSARSVRAPWSRPIPRGPPPVRSSRGVGIRAQPPPDRRFKRPVSFRDRHPVDRHPVDRHPVASMPSRARPLPPPPRSYDRRPPPVQSYSRSSMKRDYVRHDEPAPRSRASAVNYGSRAMAEGRQLYRDDDYPPPRPSSGYNDRPSSGYNDLPRGGGGGGGGGGSSSRSAPRRSHNVVDDGYGQQRYERPPPPSYREGRSRDYDTVAGSKRPYSDMDEIPPRYADSGVRQSRARLDYELGGGGGSSSQYGGSSSQYGGGDAYGDRMGRSSLGFGSSNGSGSRAPLSNQESQTLYGSSRHNMDYIGGSYGGGNSNDAGSMYSSSGYGGGSDYIPRGSNQVRGGGGGSYTSMYSDSRLGGGGSSNYMAERGRGGGGSSSYY